VIKNIIKKYFKYFTYFFRRVRYRMLVILASSFLVGILDGLGLTMFLPLLEMADGQKEVASEGLGNLSFLMSSLNSLGIKLTVNSILLVMLTFFILKGLARFFEGYYRVQVSMFFVKNLRLENIKLLSNYSFKSFITADSGRIQNTMSAEISSVTSAFSVYLNVIQASSMLFVYIFLAFLSNPQFALLITLGGFLSNFAFKFVYNKTMEISRRVTGVSHGYQGLLLQMVSMFKYLRASGLMSRYIEKLKEANEILVYNGKKSGFYSVVLTSIREPMVMLIVVVVILVQINYLGQSLASIILPLLFFFRSLNFVMNLQTQWNSFLGRIGSMENMDDFQSELKDNQLVEGDLTFENLKKEVIINNVNFSYGETKILKDIEFGIEKNQTIAFVGESGSGKTTLVNLIAGLMPVDQGNIEIDGVDINDFNKESFQNRIGYITQEPVIFNDTIFNNVTFWQKENENSIGKFWKCLEKASIGEFVKGLKDQENEILGSNGINLSGGQKQRISIARELYKDIDILIMDEATSALDSETELAIQQNIEALKGQYTILIVAHRLSTIRSADMVVLMKKGRIKEKGTYKELLQKSPSFKRMVELQELTAV